MSSTSETDAGSPEVGGPVDTEGTMPEVGAQLGVYRLESLLGEGAMGRIYLAEHTRLGRKVAVKVLRQAYWADASIARRFLSEARAVNCIGHPNIVDITDIVEQPHQYYIMELLRGQSLRDLLQEQPDLPLERTLEIASDVANALAAVHDADIVHCDIKPDNVFLAQEQDGSHTTKLLDFGIAILPDEPPPPNDSLTGTPAFMSPEQARQLDIDHRSDVYSFGVLLYQLLSNRLPFEPSSVEDLRVQHISVDPQPPSAWVTLPESIGDEVDDLVMHCLAKEADERPSSMREIDFRIAGIQRKLSEPVVSSPESQLAEPASSPAQRSPWPWVGGAIVAVAAVAAAIMGLRQEPPAIVPAAAPSPPTMPAAQVLPPEPVEYTITFDSSPRGAMIHEAGKDEPLGVTRFELRLEESQEPRTYEFRLPGHKSVTRSVTPNASANMVVRLELIAAPKPKRRSSEPKATKKREPVKSGGIKDPFAN